MSLIRNSEINGLKLQNSSPEGKLQRHDQSVLSYFYLRLQVRQLYQELLLLDSEEALEEDKQEPETELGR